jgi:aminoacrylate hydrolase
MSGQNRETRERCDIAGLAVELVGASDRPAVLLSAGLGGSRHYWERQIEALARDFYVVLYDHRGTGESARTPLRPGYAVADLAEDMALILDGLNIARAHVVGHAAGGAAGLQLAAQRPYLVRSLVVVNGWASSDPHIVRCFEIRSTIYDAEGAEGYLRAQPLFLYPAEWISRHFDALEAERARHLPQFQDRTTLFARLAALRSFDIRSQARAIETPTLILAASDDMLVPSRCSTELAAMLSTASLRMIPTGGHAVNVTNAKLFNRKVLAFLSMH